MFNPSTPSEQLTTNNLTVDAGLTAPCVKSTVTVPIGLWASEKVQMSVPAKYTNVQWFKNGSTTPIVAGNVVLLSEPGS